MVDFLISGLLETTTFIELLLAIGGIAPAPAPLLATIITPHNDNDPANEHLPSVLTIQVSNGHMRLHLRFSLSLVSTEEPRVISVNLRPIIYHVHFVSVRDVVYVQVFTAPEALDQLSIGFSFGGQLPGQYFTAVPFEEVDDQIPSWLDSRPNFDYVVVVEISSTDLSAALVGFGEIVVLITLDLADDVALLHPENNDDTVDIEILGVLDLGIQFDESRVPPIYRMHFGNANALNTLASILSAFQYVWLCVTPSQNLHIQLHLPVEAGTLYVQFH